jgi:hypothetical protein
MENYQIQFRDLLKRAVSEPGTISAAYSAFHNYSIGNQLAACFMDKAVELAFRMIEAEKGNGRNSDVCHKPH